LTQNYLQSLLNHSEAEPVPKRAPRVRQAVQVAPSLVSLNPPLAALYPKPSSAQATTTQPRNNLEDLISLLIRDNQVATETDSHWRKLEEARA